MTFRIQIAVESDLPAWLELAGEVSDLFGAEMAKDPAFAAMLRRRISGATAFCARVDGVLAGAMLFRAGVIDWLAVREPFRRRGIGRALVAHALAAGHAEVRVTTFAAGHPHAQAPAARSLYRSMGFEALEGTERAPDGTPRNTFVWRAGAADASDRPSQFYTGLVADLYEPLITAPPRAASYLPFLDRSGTPALELACGSGLPLVELVERGYEVEGLDASQDMLDRCRARAAERGLQVALHRAEMQSFSLGRRYRSIFLAGASFTLLTRDEDAACALERIHEHLEPGGSALIPLSLENRDFESMKKVLGRFTEVTTGPGDRLRVGLVALDRSVDGRSLTRRLRYERIPAGGAPEVVERDWLTRHWSQGEFEGMLAKAGFGRATFVKPEGGRSGPEDASFVALVSR